MKKRKPSTVGTMKHEAEIEKKSISVDHTILCGEVAQLVRASDCRSEGCEIVPRPSRHFQCHMIDYAEDGIQSASCGFPKQVWKSKHSSSQQRHVPWDVAYMLGAFYKVALLMHQQSTSNLRFNFKNGCVFNGCDMKVMRVASP